MGHGAAAVRTWEQVHKCVLHSLAMSHRHTSQVVEDGGGVDGVIEWVHGWPSPRPLRLIVGSERLVGCTTVQRGHNRASAIHRDRAGDPGEEASKTRLCVTTPPGQPPGAVGHDGTREIMPKASTSSVGPIAHARHEGATCHDGPPHWR